MKHVWLLNHYALEPGSAGGTRHFYLAKYLAARGWSASIIAASVELNTGRQRLGESEDRRLDVIQGVPFLWLKTPTYSGNGAGRMSNMLSYTMAALRPGALSGLHKPDVVVGSSVHPFAAFAGALLARRHRVPFVFEVRDLWPQTLVDLGRLKDNSPVTFVLRKLEAWLYRRASRIVTLLPRAADYIVPLGIPADRIDWVPNGVDLVDFPDPGAVVDDGARAFVLMYFGAHGQANGLDNVIRAMKALVDGPALPREVRLRLIGSGPAKAELQSLVASLGLKNIDFGDPVPKADIPGVAARADAFVFNLIDAPVFKFGISSNKLFDFLAGNRPILFCCDVPNNPVETAVAGLTVSPGDPQELAAAIRRLVALPIEERRAMGAAGRRYVEEHHSLESIAARFGSSLDASVEARRG